MKFKLLLTLLCTIAIFASTHAKVYYVAPAGDDSAEGTLKKPFATFGHAQKLAEPGDTVFFRQGIYHVKTEEIAGQDPKTKPYKIVYHINKSGREGAPIVFTGYQTERAIFDMSGVNPGECRLTGFLITADYIVMKQLEVVGLRVLIKGHAQSECVRMQPANHCVLENMSFHDGQAIGVYLLEGSHNLILNCDAYNNYDDYSEGVYGGNTDGFGGHLRKEEYVGNVFRGCRAWWNSDDGFDLINCAAPVRIENCVAFYNGYRPGTLLNAGDGTGIKAGGYGMGEVKGFIKNMKNVPCHVVTGCIAYSNKNRGIYSNHHLGGLEMTNNISIKNPRNFTLICRKSKEEAVDIPGKCHIMKNNVSLAPTRKGQDYTDCDTASCTLDGNLTAETMTMVKVKKIKKPRWNAENFNPSDYLVPRNADGSLPFDILKEF